MSELEHPDINGSDYLELLAGHLGYLTASQEKSLEVFKQCLHREGLYNPKADGSGRPSHDDTTLLYVRSLLSLPALLTSQADTADSSVRGSLMSAKHTNNLRIPPVGGRNTISRTCMERLTLMRWSRRRGSTLGGLVGGTR